MGKFLLAVLFAVLTGCAMLGAWKTIPPPGGCDQCHTLPISADWTAAYQVVDLMDETGKYPWQRPAANLPPQESPLQQQKVTEERCFRCHKGPNAAHTERVGRYHH